MRIGCKDPSIEREKGDLGRFGSGMKTASFSQCRQLTVISKKQEGVRVAARWDIDTIEESNSWCLEVFSEGEIDGLSGVQIPDDYESGTQIIWGKLTCVESGGHALAHDDEMAAHLSELKTYLRLHFHRFMQGRDKCLFTVNESTLEPIDPFMTQCNGYQEGRSEKMRCKGGHIVIKTHVLPHFKRMESKSLNDLGGVEGITRNQGLYIYREGRLINAGGWLGLQKNSQLGALARVQVDIPSALDNDWSTDVKKSSFQLPTKVKRELKKFLFDPVKRSKRVYRYRGKQDVANSFWKITEDENEGTITYKFDTNNEELLEIMSSLDKEKGRGLVRYLSRLSENLPINHIYEKMSESPNDINQEAIDLDLIDSIMDKVLQG